MTKWQLQSSQVPSDKDELIQILLKNRQLLDKKEQEEFLNPSSPFTWDLAALDFDLAALEIIKKRLDQAKKNKETVLIFGDYDADGVCASAILWELLTAIGIKANPFIPQRDLHGYGLSIKALQDAFSEHGKPTLLFTVDNGIVAHEALEFLKNEGVEVILTDHHQSDGEDLPLLALWHSTQVCGAAVAWFLAREILTDQAKLTSLLELAAIATVTDLMKLQGINRSILSFGLQALQKSQRPGLLALLELSGLKQADLKGQSLGFVIGPRINAMGRLANSMDALRLLCTKDQARAKKLAAILDQTNAERKDLTKDLLLEAKEQLKQEVEHQIIIISGNYHDGVIGLVAGNLTEEFLKPSIVIATEGKVAKGSARSLPAFNITEFLREVKDDLIDVGGHPMAAGFSLAIEKVELVKERLHALADQYLAGQDLNKELKIDCQLPAELLDLETVASLAIFQPHGNGNERPIFLLKNLILKNYKIIGAGKNHLKLTVAFAAGKQEWDVLAWNKVDLLESLKIGDRFDAAINLEINQWRQHKNVQFLLKEIRV